MKKVSSYQKLKFQIADLKYDIYCLVAREKEEIGIKTKLKYIIDYKIDNELWAGDATLEDYTGFFKNKKT